METEERSPAVTSGAQEARLECTSQRYVQNQKRVTSLRMRVLRPTNFAREGGVSYMNKERGTSKAGSREPLIA